MMASSIPVSLNNYVAPDNVKFLGVTLNKHLKYKSCQRANKKGLTRAFFQPHVLISFYHA